MSGIVQVIQTTLNTSFTTAVAGWQSVPGLSAIITPSSTANSILVFMKINLGSNGQNGVAFQVQRNGTPIDIGATAGSRTSATGAAFGTQAALDSGMTITEIFLDNPASLAALTYSVFVNQGNSTGVFVNRGVTDTSASNFFRTTSNIVLMEFAP